MIGIAAAPHAAVAATVAAQPWNDDNAYAANEIDAWIAIDPDDSILIRYQRSEMGQGSMTALPMMIAEELQCDWSKVRIEYASPNRNLREKNVYGDMFSNGSRSVRALAEEGAAGRRQRARAPDRRGRGAMERACDGMHSCQQRGQSPAVGPHPALRRARRRRGEDHARQRAGNQNAGSVHLHRQADAARRRAHKIDGSAQVRHRRAGPGMVFAAITACPVPGGKLEERR